jgi:hypothetical protein
MYLATADYAGYHTYNSPRDQRLVGPQSAYYAHRWLYAHMYASAAARRRSLHRDGGGTSGRRAHAARVSRRGAVEIATTYRLRARVGDRSLGGGHRHLPLRVELGSSRAETANEPVIYEGRRYNWNPPDARGGSLLAAVRERDRRVHGRVVSIAVEAGVEHLFTACQVRTRQPATDVVLRMGYDPTGQIADGNAGTIVWSATRERRGPGE